MTESVLADADILGANLTDAYLTGADLRGAELTRADLRGADLRDARNVTQRQIDPAITDETTKLPPNLLPNPPGPDPRPGAPRSVRELW